MLKKEFNTKDVNRARNLITKQGDAGSNLQSGYKKKTTDYTEGDVWEERGKKWTIKDGVKQTINKLDEIRKMALMPLFCPTCSTLMSRWQDKKFYSLHRECMDCVIEKEGKIRAQGGDVWEKYVRKFVNSKIDLEAEEIETHLTQALNESNSFFSENGELEKWVGGIPKGKIKEIIEEVKEFRETLKNQNHG
jgi:hypothetical protein